MVMKSIPVICCMYYFSVDQDRMIAQEGRMHVVHLLNTSYEQGISNIGVNHKCVLCI